MAFAWLTITDRRDDEIEDEVIRLSQPDLSEAESLPHHVDKCASRFRLLILRGSKHSRQLGITNLLLGGLILWTVLTSPHFASMMGAVLKFLAGG